MVLFLLGISLLLVLSSFMIIGVNRATSFSYHPDAMAAIDYLPEGCDENGVLNDSKMLLWRVRFYSLKYFGEFWSKPVCTCVKCMASLYSVFYWPVLLYFYPYNWQFIVIYLLYIPALSAFTEWLDNQMLT